MLENLENIICMIQAGDSILNREHLNEPDRRYLLFCNSGELIKIESYKIELADGMTEIALKIQSHDLILSALVFINGVFAGNAEITASERVINDCRTGDEFTIIDIQFNKYGKFCYLGGKNNLITLKLHLYSGVETNLEFLYEYNDVEPKIISALEEAIISLEKKKS